MSIREVVSICNVADRQGISAEVVSDHYVGSESYWRHEQDILFDVVRIMKERHQDRENYPELMQLQLRDQALAAVGGRRVGVVSSFLIKSR